MIVGNYEDKYNTRNPISRRLVSNFLSSFDNYLNQVGQPRSIVELGSGEGELTWLLAQKFPDANLSACDISTEMISLTKKRLENHPISLVVADLEKLPYKNRDFDLVICCEVLEHIARPDLALREINRISKKHIIMSVPNEPLWRFLNMIRGKYLAEFGNTPGHLNHWSSNSIKKFVVDAGFTVSGFTQPTPWTMLHLTK